LTREFAGVFEGFILWVGVLRLFLRVVVATTSWTASLNGEECIVAAQDENQRWVVQTTAA
jgi:hypothetical protein